MNPRALNTTDSSSIVYREGRDIQMPRANSAVSPSKQASNRGFLRKCLEPRRSNEERKTEFGGYRHTNLSKERISKANKGKTPWNKGRPISDVTKNKIADSQKARVEMALLETLQKKGMTKEAYEAKKKRIKSLRMQLYRTRKASDTHAHERIARIENSLKALLKEIA